MTHTAEINADTIAFVAQEVLEEHMNLGTSGRYLTDYGFSPSDLAEMIAARVSPLSEQAAQDQLDASCRHCGWLLAWPLSHADCGDLPRVNPPEEGQRP